MRLANLALELGALEEFGIGPLTSGGSPLNIVIGQASPRQRADGRSGKTAIGLPRTVQIPRWGHNCGKTSAIQRIRQRRRG
jgi:hypothetical protein